MDFVSADQALPKLVLPHQVEVVHRKKSPEAEKLEANNAFSYMVIGIFLVVAVSAVNAWMHFSSSNREARLYARMSAVICALQILAITAALVSL